MIYYTITIFHLYLNIMIDFTAAKVICEFYESDNNIW